MTRWSLWYCTILCEPWYADDESEAEARIAACATVAAVQEAKAALKSEAGTITDAQEGIELSEAIEHMAQSRIDEIRATKGGSKE